MSSRSIAPALQEFPEHAAIIADMLLSFANLEMFTVDLVGRAFDRKREGIYQAARVLYRLKGAYDRLQVADAILRPFANEHKLAGPYSQWIGAMRWCRSVRNQYAHAAWDVEEGRLCLMNMEDAAKSPEGSVVMYYSPIDLPLLKEQQAYFDYAFTLSAYLAGEFRYRRDRRQTRLRSRLPKSRRLPKLYSPPNLLTSPAQG